MLATLAQDLILVSAFDYVLKLNPSILALLMGIAVNTVDCKCCDKLIFAVTSIYKFGASKNKVLANNYRLHECSQI